jgi:selenium metabolism protein YedF
MEEIDCRGKACPEPVLLTKQALETLKEDEFILVVDSLSSCENVERFVQSQGCSVKREKREETFYLSIQRGKRKAELNLPKKEENVVVYIHSQFLGGGDEALGSFLMKAFLKTLFDLEIRPHRLILVNSGVQLAAEGSKVLESLQGLSEKEVEIVCCGTCIDFYKLQGKMRVGVISNMVDIVQSMLKADRLIKP